MRPVLLKDIALWCGGAVAPEYENVAVTGLCHDSREAEEGTLFFALEGQADGHRFVPNARAAGAAAAVVSHPVEDELPQVVVEDTRKAMRDIATEYKATLSCKTVAITGSVGKTTTRTMVCDLLGSH